MKLIPLTQGKFAQVDDDDFEELNKFKWTLTKCDNSFYALRTIYEGRISKGVYGKQKKIYLHRQIMNAPSDKLVDHKDGDGLNCQKTNMRLATKSENQRNKKPKTNGTSEYLGVCWSKKENKWLAQINIPNVRKRIGVFKSEENAAIAYNILAEKHYGEFANINKSN